MQQVQAVANSIQSAALGAATASIQQPLISLAGTVVPHPPPITGNVDPTKIDEIRRTIYVGNLGTGVRTGWGGEEGLVELMCVHVCGGGGLIVHFLSEHNYMDSYVSRPAGCVFLLCAEDDKNLKSIS